MRERTGTRVNTSADHQEELARLREQLSKAHLAQVAHRRRAIVLLEGPDCSGKKFALRQLAAAFDPCHVSVHCINFDRREASEGHWLARFWRDLPATGRTTVFYRSWYGRVLNDRLSGRIEGKELARAFDEINEFEAQQRDYGTLIAKLYFDVSAETQEQRIVAYSDNPWHRKLPHEMGIRVGHPGYQDALDDLREHSNMRWSPWNVIDGNDEPAAAQQALQILVDCWRKAMPAEPPQLVKTKARVA